MQNPDWSDVRVFLEVHRAGTLSGAGRELGVYASTVGRRLAALEASMGTVLFQRTAAGLAPTPAADEMVEAAEVMERQVQLIGQRLSGKSGALSGKVRLSCTADLATHFLVERMAGFSERHPDIEVEILTSDGFVDIARGEADMAVRFTRGTASPVPKAHEGVLVARRLPNIGVGLYASGAYLQRAGRPASSRDLAGHDVIMPAQPWIPGFDWMREYGGDSHVHLRTDTIFGLAIAARSGYGITPLPSFMAFAHAELERIRPPDRISLVQTWLIMPRDLRRVARVRAFADYVIEMFQEWEVLMAGGED
ncbi:MAG: LysR family transcriptional regulator [Proteobacteria bacterium]|nr:LysR family transcriptional regulator [Pseudomonadota bacterium]